MMSQLKSAVLAINEGDSQSDPDGAPSRAETLRARARELATNLAWVPSVTSSDTFANRCQTLSKKLGVGIRTIRREQPEPSSQNILRENTALLEASFNSVYDSLSQLHEIPHALGSGGNVIPRILIVA